MQDRTTDGRLFRMLTLIDEYSRECLAIDVARRLTSEDVLERLSDLFVRRGVPAYIRSDNGPEFTAKKVTDWLKRLEVKTLFIEPGSPWENGYNESFNGTLRYESLDVEWCDTLLEAKCSSSDGERYTIRFGLTAHWVTGHRLQKRSFPGKSQQDGACRTRIPSREMIC